jgi:hypothetical protein
MNVAFLNFRKVIIFSEFHRRAGYLSSFLFDEKVISLKVDKRDILDVSVNTEAVKTWKTGPKILTAFRIRTEVKGEWLLGLNGLVSILVGVILILRPGTGVLAVAWLIGVLAVIVGIFPLFLGLKFRRIGPSLKQA